MDTRRAFGANTPNWNLAWDEYRKGLAFGMFMWAITIMVREGIVATLVHRLSMAVAAHDSFGALGV